MAEAIVGRVEELRHVIELVDDRSPDMRAILVDGEAGIGKTTLWSEGVARARDASLRTLVAQPGQSETALPHAALADLLSPLLEERLPKLAPPLRAAIETALQRQDSAAPADQLAVSKATLELLGDAGPLLIAVDDVQWLDAPSQRTLEFALRRLRESPVRLLLTRRSDGTALHALGLDRALPHDRFRQLRLGPLDATALDELLRSRLALRLPRPALVRLERVTDGNPYYALEIAQSLADGGELELPRSLTEALDARIASLPPAARYALLLAAACLQPAPDLVERAAGDPLGLRIALEQGSLEASGRRLRFTHPLLASVAYERALPSERRDAHRRLAAAAAAGSDERAVHLARGHETPDDAIVAELEGAAEAAAARGGPGLAAELAEAAAALTPPADRDGRRRRLASAADHHEAEGDPARGRELLEQVIADMTPGPERAALLVRLVDMLDDAPMEELIRMCEQALAEAEGAPSLASEIHTVLSAVTWIAGDHERSLDHSRASVRHAEEVGDEARLAIAIGDACNSEALLALPWNREAMARALEIEERVEDLPPWHRPSYQLAVISIVTDDLDTARPLVASELERARRLGNEPGVTHLLLRVAELELRAGRWSEALRAAREAHALARQGGLDVDEATVATALALVLAHLGQLEEARSLAESAYGVAVGRGHRRIAIRAAGVLGFIQLQAGNSERALEWLTPVGEELRRTGMGELSISGVVQNEIEALVAGGRLEEAETVAAFVEEKGRPSRRSWHRAVAARGRALVASARGDVAAARKAIEEALEAHESLPQPFERARTLLTEGLVERRARRWGPAREALSQALELFDELGAARFSERTAAELARLPGRRPRSGELTETEQRVAQLVAQGLSNKEVAATLFMAVRTVEANLTKVYAKLGIHSRTELASRLRT